MQVPFPDGPDGWLVGQDFGATPKAEGLLPMACSSPRTSHVPAPTSTACSADVSMRPAVVGLFVRVTPFQRTSFLQSSVVMRTRASWPPMPRFDDPRVMPSADVTWQRKVTRWPRSYERSAPGAISPATPVTMITPIPTTKRTTARARARAAAVVGAFSARSAQWRVMIILLPGGPSMLPDRWRQKLSL